MKNSQFVISQHNTLAEAVKGLAKPISDIVGNSPFEVVAMTSQMEMFQPASGLQAQPRVMVSVVVVITWDGDPAPVQKPDSVIEMPH